MEIACILADGFEDSEYRIPCDRLTASGFDVVVIGPEQGQTLVGKNDKEHVVAQRSIDGAVAGDYDALLIPGGRSPKALRADKRFIELVKEFNKKGKLIAAVCHGAQVLISAGLVQGRTMTAWPSVQKELREAGAKVVDEEVVVDRNFITSRKPEDLEAFSSAILSQLDDSQVAQTR